MSRDWFTGRVAPSSRISPCSAERLSRRLFRSCCYWYQTELRLKFPALAPVDKRIPRIYAVEAQGAVKP